MESSWRWGAATVNTTEGPYRFAARLLLPGYNILVCNVDPLTGLFDMLLSVDGGLTYVLLFRQPPQTGVPHFPYGLLVAPD